VFDANYICTLGIDFSSKVIRVEDTPCKLEIWDTAGQERYSGITTSYYRGAQGAMLVYDVTSRESFQHVENWAARVSKYGGTDLEMVLVGNKVRRHTQPSRYPWTDMQGRRVLSA
jgi:Ras-related protein Rab-1A